MRQAKYNQAIKLCRENLAVYENSLGQDNVRVRFTKDLIMQAASMDFPTGAHVRISTLVSRPELNGQQGVVLHVEHETARYGVQLADGTEILLKPECLTHIASTQAEHG